MQFQFSRKHSINKDETKADRRNYRWGLVIIAGTTLLILAWLIYRWGTQPLWLTRLPDLLLEVINLTEAASVFTIMFVWVAIIWRQRRQPVEIMPALTVAELYALSPGAFERYVAGLFRQKGYQVKVRGRSGDMGVDLEIKDPSNRKAIAQCKRYRHTVGPEVVRELYGTLIHERVTRGFLVTTAEISDSAREWAQNKPLTLIDGKTLVEIATSLREQNVKS